MPVNTALLAELKHEATNTRKMIERVPSDKLEWRPHEKSMTIGRLATHIANIPIWFDRIINADEFDFATANFNTEKLENTDAILQLFDKRIDDAVRILESASDETLNALCTFRRGDHIFFQLPKKATLRNFSYNHLYHHRGQLSVYLRLLDIAVPGMYGPSADESM
ncbi:DinB family protein [Ginsengibacter hankyongi]|uniref:DinB family protein n=1 Tax=Ginsengibacter hankyongi TaxID=2607284 RepID=A0A5J5IAW4_9BACT|nr:DinB family protein [Ginsengibacter hankyongi]KAA9035878.1 DinB family protein [Ginsengibacter hankyongi]